jgi:hypothetical protein
VRQLSFVCHKTKVPHVDACHVESLSQAFVIKIVHELSDCVFSQETCRFIQDDQVFLIDFLPLVVLVKGAVVGIAQCVLFGPVLIILLHNA